MIQYFLVWLAEWIGTLAIPGALLYCAYLMLRPKRPGGPPRGE